MPHENRIDAIDGLKFRVHSSKARTVDQLFSKILKGKNVAVPGFDSCFSWDDSPMKIYIQFSDEIFEEETGPVGIIYRPSPDFEYPPLFFEEATNTLFIPNTFKEN